MFAAIRTIQYQSRGPKMAALGFLHTKSKVLTPLHPFFMAGPKFDNTQGIRFQLSGNLVPELLPLGSIKAWNSIQPNQKKLFKKVPAVLETLKAVESETDKHDNNGTMTISNNKEYFENVEESLALARELKIEVGKIKDELQLYKEETVENCWCELASARQNCRKDLDKWYNPEAYMNTTPRTPEEQAMRIRRNLAAHQLSLHPALQIVEENPNWELDFNVWFGLPSSEATLLDQFDDTREFRVHEILSCHARLWRSAMADTFIQPYKDWLLVIRHLVLLPKSHGRLENTVKPELHIQLAALAEAARDAARLDIQNATRKNLLSPHRKLRKGVDGNIGYNWDPIVSDWKERGVWEAMWENSEWRIGQAKEVKSGVEGEAKGET